MHDKIIVFNNRNDESKCFHWIIDYKHKYYGIALILYKNGLYIITPFQLKIGLRIYFFKKIAISIIDISYASTINKMPVNTILHKILLISVYEVNFIYTVETYIILLQK